MPNNSSNFPDRFTRTIDMYGEEGFAKIRDASVAVIGLGGVGSHAATALARGGVGSLILVDFDLLTVSSLNRHPCASLADVGRAKTEILAEFLNTTCPDTTVTPIKEFFHTDTCDKIFSLTPDYVVDAIDSSNPKCALLEECFNRKIDVVSSMGASSHGDFSKIRTGDLFDSTICPLASRIRKFLRRRNVGRGIQCVWSVEPHGPHLPPDIGDRTIDRGRIRNRLPSSISMPGVFGYTIASMILDSIAEKGSHK